MQSPSKRVPSPPSSQIRQHLVGVEREREVNGEPRGWIGEKKWRNSGGPIPNPPNPLSSNGLLFSCLFIIQPIHHMGTLLLFLFTGSLFYVLVSGVTYTELIFPNFTASSFKFVDNAGAFLLSRNGTFKAAIFNPGVQKAYYYLCVMHAESGTVIWSANRDGPISSSGKMALTAIGITIAEQNGNDTWSTPPLRSSVNSLMLTEAGNLVLLDQFNHSLWESFHYPTDTIVMGQHLLVDAILSSAVSDDDLSTGDYKLTVSDSDVLLQWFGNTYWKLSMDARSNRNSNYINEYMEINGTGLFLFGRNGSEVVTQVSLPPSKFRIAQLDASGQFMISSFLGTVRKQEFVGPIDGCRIPFVCGRLGLCTGTTSKGPICSCPQGFLRGPQDSSGCVPSDGFSLPLACNSTKNDTRLNSSDVSYLRLGYGMGYFSIGFSEPIEYGMNLSVCQDVCTANCSCLGIYYRNSSGSCYVFENELGSVIASTTDDDDNLGYIKILGGNDSTSINGSTDQRQVLPVIALVLLPMTGIFIIVAFSLLWLRKRTFLKNKETKLGHANSISSGDLDAFYIPGLPQRFDYEDLEVATDNFKTKIGSGGFGVVYKGTLPDKSTVAVKKLATLGVQGKKEFCAEIAVIGNIHHVNLVKLRGFCAQGSQCLLVYEYMNRGSLDRTLFGTGPVLEWQERFEIALGTARGLAYLHSGCDQKIIHCDVKPENILLHDSFQAKISDFGLSKLVGPEQSSLFTTMRGTRGYLAPEWLTNSAISEKTDVYSYGMVLLELVSGRKNCTVQSHSMDASNSGCGQSTSSSGSGFVYFPLFALEMHEQGNYLELADPRLEGRVTSEEAERLVRVALCCVQEEPLLRPAMASVVGMLEGGTPLGQPRIESLNFLRFYGRRFTEASMIGEGNEQSGTILYPEANTSATRTTNGSHACFSYISSQQISGPR
ncbi:hypothetical protein DKX38_002414 [Salix brachista]|uniref:non-specific serine/threonine protein kinase n=1 Tax=Salix brachista TaxID=2182728 RepID=A0A5N5NPY7_9ROSI|nr:hypothetical protein DKX38_002414 [Salix brachista]